MVFSGCTRQDIEGMGHLAEPRFRHIVRIRRNGHRCQNPYDGHHDHELDQRKPCLFPFSEHHRTFFNRILVLKGVAFFREPPL